MKLLHLLLIAAAGYLAYEYLLAPSIAAANNSQLPASPTGIKPVGPITAVGRHELSTLFGNGDDGSRGPDPQPGGGLLGSMDPWGAPIVYQNPNPIMYAPPGVISVGQLYRQNQQH